MTGKKMFRVTWERELLAMTPREAMENAALELAQQITHGEAWPAATVVCLDDDHTSSFDAGAAESLR